MTVHMDVFGLATQGSLPSSSWVDCAGAGLACHDTKPTAGVTAATAARDAAVAAALLLMLMLLLVFSAPLSWT